MRGKTWNASQIESGRIISLLTTTDQPMSNENIIQRAEFSPKVCTYWLLSGAVVFTMTIVGIPLLLLWFPIGYAITRRYLARMECVLTDKALKVRKGIFVRVEKTIPLEKITTMGMVQGPIMRFFDLHTLTVETAGQSGVGSLVSLTGIVQAPDFRESVLNQRESQSVTQATVETTQTDNKQLDASGDAILSEIRDTLVRIESLLEKKNSQ